MNFDLVIIGAGPAGMAAATTASELGLRCVLLDEQPRCGGQIYRNVGRQSLPNKAILGPEYQAGLPLLTELQASTCQIISGATVWQINTNGEVFYSVAGQSTKVQGGKILIATGAQERPMPIPGATLPGVMMAGGAQVMLKNSGVGADESVFAGNGPLLYLLVWQYLQAGLKVKAVIETSPRSNTLAAAKHWRGAIAGHRYISKGLKLLRDIKTAGVPIYKQVSRIEALADTSGTLTAVSFMTPKGERRIDTEHLFLHQGVIPQVNLAMASGCQHHWSEQQFCWVPTVDLWGQSNQPCLMIAGDGQGIGGGVAAAQRGRLAALQVALTEGKLTTEQRDQRAAPIQKTLQRELAFRPFIDALYAPSAQFRMPIEDDVVICRCEEVRRSDLVAAVKQGCLGPNQLKSFTRCGMGPCQGRQCGNTVSEMMATLTHNPVQQSGYYRLRAPVKPLTLAELASLSPPS